MIPPPRRPGVMPPAKRGSIGWIIAGVAGAVVALAVLAVGVLFALGAVWTKASGEPSGKPSTGVSTTAGSPTPTRTRAAGTYTYIKHFCRAIDTRPFREGGYTNDSPPKDLSLDLTSGRGIMTCFLSLKNGAKSALVVRVMVKVNATNAEAVRAYKQALSRAANRPFTPIPGPWQQAESAGRPVAGRMSYGVYAQDGNVAASVFLEGNGVPWSRKVDKIGRRVLVDIMRKLRK